MKKALVLLALLFVVAVFLVHAATTTMIGSMTTVNGTTNTAAVSLGNIYPPRGVFYIQNGGLASTNALLINVQLSIDGTNFYTVATYYPSVTNATTDAYAPTYSALPVYMRAQVVTTNAVQVGGIYTQ